MKRAAIFLGIAGLTPLPAEAQIPVAPNAEARTPAPDATPSAPTAPDATAPAKPAPATPPPAAQPPGDEYFVEPQPGAPSAPAGPSAPEPSSAPPPFEPPAPPMALEPPPPPPPQIRHEAPMQALVLGARVGWFIPFGNLWARADAVSTASGTGYVLHGVPWRDYASSGPMFELDAGVRLARAYTLFALWERAQLGSGNAGGQDGAESDFFAAGLRASSNPDHLGFLTEVAVGYRRARTFFSDGFEYQFTDAPFEARLGLGAELRLNRMSSLSGLLTIGVGSFGDLNAVAPNGNSISLPQGFDQGDGHAWATITIGGHFDLIGSHD